MQFHWQLELSLSLLVFCLMIHQCWYDALCHCQQESEVNQGSLSAMQWVNEDLHLLHNMGRDAGKCCGISTSRDVVA